jgi:hypothetical protein
MPFGTATKTTNKGVAIMSGRMIGATPSQAEPKYVAFGVGATSAARTAAVGDNLLSSELTEGRATGTATQQTTTVTNDTTQWVGSVTASGSRAVDESMLFDVATTGAGNNLISATFPVVNLLSGDAIQGTFKEQFVPG